METRATNASGALSSGVADVPERRVFLRDPALTAVAGPATNELLWRSEREMSTQANKLRWSASATFGRSAPLLPAASGLIAKDLARRNATVSNGSFNTHRDLGEYMANCGPSLALVLTRLAVQGGAWLDVGAGQAVAMSEFRELAGEKPRLVALTAAPLAMAFGRKYNVERAKGLVCLENRRLETVTPSEVGQFQLITDVLGAASYADQLDVVMRRMLELAKVGGYVMISVNRDKTKFTRPDGAAYDWTEWLGAARGAQLLETGLCDEGGVNRYLVLKKTSAAVGLQRLVLTSFTSGAPPLRGYRLLNSSAGTAP